MTIRAVVTGGGGFIGAYLVKKFISMGWAVTVIDTMIRGSGSRFGKFADQVRLVSADVRDEDKVCDAARGSDVVFHLAAINGTENFYKRPELVLDVGLRGALAVVGACRRAGVPDLVVASSAEVYQTPPVVPTPEDVPLTLPNSFNPRYSYGGSKIISELIAFNYAQDHFRKVQVFRPHNVYGPDMGFKHVVPQFLLRAAEAIKIDTGTPVPFQIQGDGSETRAFCYVDDVVDGIVTMYVRGGHRELYHIGNDEEVTIRTLAERVGKVLGGQLRIVAGPAIEGGTRHRCPDISKIRALGYVPAVGLDEGLRRTGEWYMLNRHIPTDNELM